MYDVRRGAGRGQRRQLLYFSKFTDPYRAYLHIFVWWCIPKLHVGRLLPNKQYHHLLLRLSSGYLSSVVVRSAMLQWSCNLSSRFLGAEECWLCSSLFLSTDKQECYAKGRIPESWSRILHKKRGESGDT